MSFSGGSHNRLYILFLQGQSSLTATRPSSRLTCVNVSAFELVGFIASLKNRPWLDFELVAICSDRHNVVHLAASGCNVAAVGADRNCLDFQIVAVFTHPPQIALLPASGGNIATVRAVAAWIFRLVRSLRTATMIAHLTDSLMPDSLLADASQRLSAWTAAWVLRLWQSMLTVTNLINLVDTRMHVSLVVVAF